MIILLLIVMIFFILGRALLLLLNFEHGVGLSFILGFIVTLASFEIIALPFMLLKGNLDKLIIVFCVYMILITLFSGIVIYKKKSKIKMNFNFLNMNKKSNRLWVIFSMLFIFQISCVFLLAHMDADDSFYIGVTNSAIYSNQIFAFEPSMGIASLTFPPVYSLTGYEILIGLIAIISSIKPTILYHSVLPVIYITFSYIAIFHVGKKLIFCEKLPFFMIGISIMNIFGAYSVYSTGSFLLFRSWQGKAIIPSILIPMMLYFFVCSMEKVKKEKDYLIIMIILIAGICVSTVGVYLLPVLFSVLILTYSLNTKSIRPILNSVVFILPSFFFLILYLSVLLNSQEYSVISNIPYDSNFLVEVIKFFNNNLNVIALYLVSILYFIFKGNKMTRFLFCYVPGILVLTFLNPFLMPLVSKYLTGSVVYWRLFWLIPVNISIIVNNLDHFEPWVRPI